MITVFSDQLTVWTDGSCRVHTTQQGTWAYVLLKGSNIIHEDYGLVDNTTNSRMELQAIIESLCFCVSKLDCSKIKIFSDSENCIKGITEWIDIWKQNNWKNSRGKLVKNRDLWEELDLGVSILDTEFVWVKGHDNIKWNEYVDNLTQLAYVRCA